MRNYAGVALAAGVLIAVLSLTEAAGQGQVGLALAGACRHDYASSAADRGSRQQASALQSRRGGRGTADARVSAAINAPEDRGYCARRAER